MGIPFLRRIFSRNREVGFFTNGWLSLRGSPRPRCFFPQDPLIGLDIGSQTVKLVQLRPKLDKWQIQYCGVKSLPWFTSDETPEVSERAIEEAIKELVREGHLDQTQVTCSIRGPSVMIKFIQVPNMTALEFDEHLGWEIDQYIPSEASNLYWDYHIVDREYRKASEAMMSVLLVAVRKEAVHNRVELIKRSGLIPLVVDVDPLALSNMYAFNYQGGDPKNTLLIQVSPGGVAMNAMNEGIPVFMREIAVGPEGFRELMEQTVRNSQDAKLTGNAGQGSDFPEVLLKEAFVEISKEIKNTLEFCAGMDPPHHIQKLFLCGGYAGIPALTETIRAEVTLPLEFVQPVKRFEFHSRLKNRESIQSFELLGGVAIGLAIRGIAAG